MEREKLVINGGNPLTGEIEVSGMKNSAVAIIFGTILTEGKCVIENLPDISDVSDSLEILSSIGAKIKRLNKTTYEIDTSVIRPGSSPYNLVRKMRASYYILGAELGRFGKAHAAYPGGCDFGTRPIDQHIKGFEALGAKVDFENGYIDADTDGKGMCGSNIYMDCVTVGATINIMLAACRAKGTTIIDNAAREPHVVDLANFLNASGANISGAGTDVIKIKGVEQLHGVDYAVIPDMIEAGTFMVAAAATGGDLLITNVIPKHMESVSAKLIEMGVNVEEYDDSIRISRNGPLSKIAVKTLPYPGFPTDMNPQMCVLMCLANGVSTMTEGVWDNRFRYVEELSLMGAKITVNGKTATIEGPTNFSGAPVKAVDLRAGAAMIIAGLIANGKTEIDNIRHIQRGYENIVEKLSGAGADIRLVTFAEDTSVSVMN
ncbi:MAG: UDP-N-acetylglucosamine 1-carboxyvinyltransferase [Ruminococcaceae bacterium]|nr:UDP-N-acetylglucosamine 1-carboxyvinyltransferase [Oscillospiraceae bacterium]